MSRQHDLAWLQSASIDEIRSAYSNGQLTNILDNQRVLEDQLTHDEYNALSHEERIEAYKSGRVDAVLGREVSSVIPEGQLSRTQLAGLSFAQQQQAYERGQLTDIVSGETVE